MTGVSLRQTTVLIYNPAAGRLLRRPKLLPVVMDELRRSIGVVEPIVTDGPRRAGTLARRAIGAGAGHVIAFGGDGTVNEVAAAVARSDVTLSVLPGGTANVLCNELGVGNDPVRAARQLADAIEHRIAIGTLTECDSSDGPRHFLLMAGIGFDARIVYHLSGPLKDRLGKLAYWAGALSTLGRRLDTFEVVLGAEVHTCTFALASRVRNYGGDLAIARGADLLGDEFEVVLFEGETALRYLFYFGGIVTRTLRWIPGVKIFRARQIAVRAPKAARIDVQVDGELVGCLPASIEILPGALTLTIPRSFLARRASPAQTPSSSSTTLR